MRVVRLKNSKQGKPYLTELVETSTGDDAEKLAARWWASGGTLGVVIFDGREIIARSEKLYLNPGRVPWESWPAKAGNPPPIRANAGAQVETHRLKEGSGAVLYQHEKCPVESLDDANVLAAKWWEDPGTVSVLVVVVSQNGEPMEDARYVQPGLDMSRVPTSWILPEALPVEPVPPSPELVGKPPPGEVSGPIFDVPLPKPVGPVPTDGCPCCMRLRPTEPDPHDDDRTPSGRIANFRCSLCGQLVGQDAWSIHWAYEGRMAASHASLDKPWNPKR